MGGNGSGGHNGQGRIVGESLKRLDIRGPENWRHLDIGSPVLSYCSPSYTEVALRWRPCRFGGSRPFLVCPRCLRSSLVLYVWGGRLLCRVCARVAYASQRHHRQQRLLRASLKLRVRLGQEPSHRPPTLLDPIPERPCGMWQRTYDRLVERLVTVENAILGLANSRLGWLMARRRWHSENG
jgi:hypothetical protein